jgi:hypothetical protein
LEAPGQPLGDDVGVLVGVSVGLVGAVAVGVLLGDDDALGEGNALWVGVDTGLAAGLENGATVTVAMAVTVLVTVAVAVTVLVTVAYGCLGRQTTLTCFASWWPVFTGLTLQVVLVGLVVAWTAPTVTPTTTRTAVSAAMAARLGVMAVPLL